MDGTPFRGISDPTIEGVEISGLTFLAARMYSVWLTKSGDVTFNDCEWKVRPWWWIWFLVGAGRVLEISGSSHTNILFWHLPFFRITLLPWCPLCWTFSMAPIPNFLLSLTRRISVYVKTFGRNLANLPIPTHRFLDTGKSILWVGISFVTGLFQWTTKCIDHL